MINKVEWISVNEMFPEEGMDVLVVKQSITGNVKMAVAYRKYNNWVMDIDGYDYPMEDEPTHWAFLPVFPVEV